MGKKKGFDVVQRILRSDSKNVEALWLKANLMDNPQQKLKLLRTVVYLDPSHWGARRLVDALELDYQLKPEQMPIPNKSRKVVIGGKKSLDDIDMYPASDLTTDETTVKFANYLIICLCLFHCHT